MPTKAPEPPSTTWRWAIGLVCTASLAANGYQTNRIGAMDERLRSVEIQAALSTQSIAALLAVNLQRALDAATILHRPEAKFANRDRLLVTWASNALTPTDWKELTDMLNVVLTDKQEPDEARRLAAEILRAMQTQQRDRGSDASNPSSVD